MCASKILTEIVSQDKRQCFSRESVLIKHNENCLTISGKQPVILEKGIIEFENILNKYQFHLKFMLILSII